MKKMPKESKTKQQEIIVNQELTKEKIENEKANNRLTLKNDIIFKAFFSRKGNEKYLIEFLNALLGLQIKEIEIREEVNLEQLSIQEKGGRLDLQALLDTGMIVNIELQVSRDNYIENRTEYYSSKVISRETARGTDYKDIKKVIMINILDYKLLNVEDYISKTAIVLDNHREYEVLKGIQWYFIELPKFRQKHPNMNETINQWLAFIDNTKGLVEVAEEKNKTLEKARFEMNYLTGEDAISRMAELKEKWELDRRSELLTAQEDTKYKIAKKLLKKGMKIKEIMQIVDLEESEIEKLVKEK